MRGRPVRSAPHDRRVAFGERGDGALKIYPPRRIRSGDLGEEIGALLRKRQVSAGRMHVYARTAKVPQWNVTMAAECGEFSLRQRRCGTF